MSVADRSLLEPHQPPAGPSAGPSSLPETIIRPQKGWTGIDWGELYRYRELLYSLAFRDIKVRYKQTVLGAAWAIIQPTLMMLVFTVFFKGMAGVPSGNIPYPVFVYAGVIAWNFFASSITNAASSVVGSERLVTKIYFPRLLVPFASVGAAIADFLVAFGLLLGLMLWYRIAPGWGLLLMPVVFTLIMLLGLGVGTLFSALNVAYRDVRYIIPFFVQFGLFATPTIYMQPKSGGWFNLLLLVNPMTGLVSAFRAAVLGTPFLWESLALPVVLTIVAFAGGCLYFRKVEGRFADII